MIGGVPDLPVLVAVSVYDTNPVDFSQCFETQLTWCRKHGKFMTLGNT